MPTTKCLYCTKHPRNGRICSGCKLKRLQAERFKKTVAAFIDSVELPGFTKTVTPNKDEFWSGKKRPWWMQSTCVALENTETCIKIRINVSHGPTMHAETRGGKKKPYVHGDGHTEWKTESGHWASFDRLGVSDSFYIGAYGDNGSDISETLLQQVIRVGESRERSEHMVSIPGFGYRVHQDNLDALKKKIQSGGSHSFTPNGFGTGHRVSTRPSRYAVRMPQETAAFFGVGALYDETFDHD
jgi:hypothetical protein